MQRMSKLSCWGDEPCEETFEDEMPYGERGHMEGIWDTLADSPHQGPRHVGEALLELLANPATHWLQITEWP